MEVVRITEVGKITPVEHLSEFKIKKSLAQIKKTIQEQKKREGWFRLKKTVKNPLRGPKEQGGLNYIFNYDRNKVLRLSKRKKKDEKSENKLSFIMGQKYP